LKLPVGGLSYPPLLNSWTERQVKQNMSIDIDLGQVQEKEPLRVASYTFSFKDAPTVEPTKAGDGFNVVADLVPEGYPNDGFRHWFSLKPGALSSTSTTISIRKFLATVGYPNARLQGEASQPVRVIASDGSEVLLKYLRFRASVRHEKREGTDQPNVRLDKVEGAA